jgi:type IV pilus assembly protein PilN
MMIRINLLPAEEKQVRRSMPTFKRPSGLLLPLVLLGTGISVVVGAVVHQQAQLQSLGRDLKQVEAEIQRLAPEVALVERLGKERAELDLRLSVIDQLSEKRFHAVRLLDELDRAVPDYLWLAGAVQTDEDKMSIEGVTFSNLIIADYMTRLDRSPYFSDIDLGVAERGEIEERDVVKFKLSMKLTPVAEPKPAGDK